MGELGVAALNRRQAHLEDSDEEDADWNVSPYRNCHDITRALENAPGTAESEDMKWTEIRCFDCDVYAVVWNVNGASCACWKPSLGAG